MKKMIPKIILPVFLFLILPGTGMANKTSVSINAPKEVDKGTEVLITINVKHMGNTAGHFTDWIYLKVNDKEVKRWEYTKNERPEAGNFTLEYKFVVNEKSKIEIKGNCNKHGSAGAEEMIIELK
ncbi:MAG: hypothetical protein JSV24_01225 [Bacteroidales bacterium]|nr:MAG: hypothetical protein JSV24_01225 [Bacteroidales bacterium]